MSIRLPRQPSADPAQGAALTPFVREIARRCGDTDDVTAARRAAMAAELRQHERRSEGAAA